MLDLFDAKKPFCLIKRRADTKLLYLSGEINFLDRLDQIPRKTGATGTGAEVFDSLPARRAKPPTNRHLKTTHP